MHLLTEHVITQTFLGFCFSQLYMFLHTANRLWRLGAWREGQLHSETCIEVDARNKRREKERDSSKKKKRRQIREIKGQERVGEKGTEERKGEWWKLVTALQQQSNTTDQLP